MRAEDRHTLYLARKALAKALELRGIQSDVYSMGEDGALSEAIANAIEVLIYLAQRQVSVLETNSALDEWTDARERERKASDDR